MNKDLIKNVRKIQLKELKVLKKFDSLCIKNNINYFLGFGNLLGAVRHKGFIPWDDDVDIIMPEEDYKKLLHPKNILNEKGLKLKKYKREFSFEQLISKLTFFEEKILFDIFVLRKISGKNINQKLQLNLSRLFFLIEFFQYRDYSKSRREGVLWELFLKFFKLFQKIFKRFNLLEKSFPLYMKIFQILNTKEKAFLLLGPKLKFICLEEKDVFPIQRVKYERYKFPILRNYNKFLKTFYGNYMKLPPLKERMVHHI